MMYVQRTTCTNLLSAVTGLVIIDRSSDQIHRILWLDWSDWSIFYFFLFRLYFQVYLVNIILGKYCLTPRWGDKCCTQRWGEGSRLCNIMCNVWCVYSGHCLLGPELGQGRGGGAPCPQCRLVPTFTTTTAQTQPLYNFLWSFSQLICQISRYIQVWCHNNHLNQECPLSYCELWWWPVCSFIAVCVCYIDVFFPCRAPRIFIIFN